MTRISNKKYLKSFTSFTAWEMSWKRLTLSSKVLNQRALVVIYFDKKFSVVTRRVAEKLEKFDGGGPLYFSFYFL